MSAHPETIYCGRREDVIREVGGLTHIYPGEFLIQPDGPAAYDAEGADTSKEMDEVIAYFRAIYPQILVVRL